MFTPIQYLDRPFYDTGGGEPTPVNGITEFGSDPINSRMALWNADPGITRHCEVDYGGNGLNAFMPEDVRRSTIAWLCFLNNANANFNPVHQDMSGPTELDRLPIDLSSRPAPIPKENRGYTYYSMELPSLNGGESYFILWVPRKAPGDGGYYYESEGFRTVAEPYPAIQLPTGKNWRLITPSGKVWNTGSADAVWPGGMLEVYYPGNGGIWVSTPEPAGSVARRQDVQGGAPLRNVLTEPSRIRIDYTF